MEIGKIIKELRKERNINQSELAKMLCTTQDTISLWELGKSYPDIINLVRLSEIFNVSTDYLLGIEK